MFARTNRNAEASLGRPAPGVSGTPAPAASATDPVIEIAQATTDGHAATPARPATASAYVAARQEWNERYGDYVAQARNWRLCALFIALIALVLAGALGYNATLSKRIPYIVEVDKLGRVSSITPAEQVTPASPRLMKAMIARFVIDWRAVSADAVVQKAATLRLYKMVSRGSAALEKMNAYYRENSPFVIGQSMTVSVELTAAPLPLSDKSWQIGWVETRRGLNGAIVSRILYKVVLTAAVNPPKDDDQTLDLDNPIGLYITDLDWSPEQMY